MQTLDDAKIRVSELGEGWPGEYVIENAKTGKCIFVSTRDEAKR
jgi:hypothetical protein